jgi:type IV secretory pathway VirJ component
MFARRLPSILFLSLLMAVSAGAAPRRMHEHSGEWGRYEVWLPEGAVRDLAFLLSPATGIEAADRAAAQRLTAMGFAVALVDTGAYLHTMGRVKNPVDPVQYRDDRAALDTFGAFNWVAHYLEQKLKLPTYRAPYLAGRDEGATLAYVILAQSPRWALAGAVGANYRPRFPAARRLCQLATTPTAGGQALADYPLGAPWQTIGATGSDYPDGIANALGALRARADAEPGAPPERMPVVEVSTASTRGLLVVIYSGDGGWRDVDKRIGDSLGREDVAVLGVDALTYFWRERGPDQLGRDLAALLAHYREAWKMSSVALIGYSMGADVLPFAYNRLPAEEQRHVIALTLLAPGRATPFAVDLTGGSDANAHTRPIPPELARLDRTKVQCVYGEGERKTSLCTDPAAHGAEIIRTAGDHHFDGDHEALAAKLLAEYRRRIDARP